MKHVLFIWAGLMLAAAPALAGDAPVPAAQALAELRAAYGKQIDVSFSDAFAAGRLAAKDVDGVIVYGVRDGKLCLLGEGKGIEASAPGLSGFASPDGGGDICVPLADVSIRMPPHEPVEDAAPVPFYATDRTACNWVWRAGKDLGLWTETCKFGTVLWQVNYDPARDLFVLRANEGEVYPVLQEFHQPGGAAALLPSLKRQGLVFDKAECQMAQVADQPAPQGWTAWQVVPTGKLKEEFDRQVQVEVPEPPCGKLGYDADSVGFFMVKDDTPDRVVYANLGQDGTMIDLNSIRFR